MMTSNNGTTPQLAVWYFVGATFLFTGPTLFFSDAPLWATVLSLVLGGVAMALGGLRFAKEMTRRRDGNGAVSDDPPTPT